MCTNSFPYMRGYRMNDSTFEGERSFKESDDNDVCQVTSLKKSNEERKLSLSLLTVINMVKNYFFS